MKTNLWKIVLQGASCPGRAALARRWDHRLTTWSSGIIPTRDRALPTEDLLSTGRVDGQAAGQAARRATGRATYRTTRLRPVERLHPARPTPHALPPLP